MTFPAFSRSPKIFLRALSCLAAVLLLHSCATPEDSESKRHRPDTNSSRFEWAVQHYEAGNYQEAIQSFEGLRKEGPSLSTFELLPFYIGMSHYKLGEFEAAKKDLEDFVRAGGDRQEAQEARVTLLLVYEKLRLWPAAASLATETDKLTLFQDNRALLKLVWARALREQGEILGAKAALDEAQPFLDKVDSDAASQPFYVNPEQDLWGRYYFTSLLVKETQCSGLKPRETGGPVAAKAKGKKPAKKKKAAPLKRIYNPWLEGVTDCYREAVNQAAENLWNRDTPWASSAEVVLAEGIQGFGAEIQSYLKDETPILARHRALEKAARENLYRLLATIEEKIKIFKNQHLSADNLESIRKIVDPLLMRISSP